MIQTCASETCDRPTKSTALCERCTKTLDVALGNIPAYYRDLETLRTRQTRYGSGNGGRSTEKPLGFDTRFESTGTGTEADLETRRIIGGWVKQLLRERPPVTGPVCATPCLHRSCADNRRRTAPAGTVTSYCAYLQRNLRWITGRPGAAKMLDDVTGLERKLRRLIDRPNSDHWYAGVCGSLTLNEETEAIVTCDRELYVAPGSPFVRCRDCGATHDVKTRRGALLQEAEDREATTEAIVRIVTTLGDHTASSAKLSARIRTWAVRGKLHAHGRRVVDGRERPTYRVGDVLSLLLGTERKPVHLHHLELEHDEDGAITGVQFACNGDRESPCHQYPDCQCETWEPDHEHPDVPHDDCALLPWLDWIEHGIDLEPAHDPETPFPDQLHSGPVDLTWDGDDVTWRYTEATQATEPEAVHA